MNVFEETVSFMTDNLREKACSNIE